MDTALFVASKVLFFFSQPSSLCIGILFAGLLMAWWRPASRTGLRVAAAGGAALLVGGLSPLANIVLTPLEYRFPRPSLEDVGPVRGLIILGGFEDGASHRAGELGLNEAAERMTEGARLARLITRTKVVFTGGVGTLLRNDVAQADQVGRWLIDMGIAPSRIVLEDRSRNTWENAVETRRVLGTDAEGRWLLVTSAHHMPRSIGVFRKAGFDVVAWPVDLRTSGWRDATRTFASVPDGLRRLDSGTKEWIGLVAYWLMGRTSALYPAP